MQCNLRIYICALHFALTLRYCTKLHQDCTKYCTKYYTKHLIIMKEEISIPTISHDRKQPKARYIKPASVKQLEKDYFAHKYQDSVIPENCRFVTKFRDDSANALTDCIEKWCKVNGHHFQRMNSFGLYDVRLKKWRPSGTTKGISDALLIVSGQTIHLEIKYGRDKQSDVQKDIQKSIEASGGTYLIAKTFDDFLTQINSINKLKPREYENDRN